MSAASVQLFYNDESHRYHQYYVPLHGVVGGLPTKPASHSQRWLPARLVQTELGPHGALRHSSTSTQVGPEGVNPPRQKHWPSWHSALLTQSKLPLQSVATSTYMSEIWRRVSIRQVKERNFVCRDFLVV